MSPTTERTYELPALDEALETHDAISGVHLACKAVAMISAEDFNRLVQSIEQDGMLTPVQVDNEGLLLDGRCRLLALHTLGMSIPKEMIDVVDTDPWKVAASNEARRHLTKGQKNLVAAKRLEAERKNAKKRQSAGAKKANKRRVNPVATESVATGRKAPVLDTVAKSEGLSREDLRRAELLRKNEPDLAEQVENGELEWDAAMERSGLNKPKPKKIKKKSRSKKRKPIQSKGAEPQMIDELSHDELTALRFLSNQLCEQAAHNDLTKVIRNYLRACDEEYRPDYQPSLEQLALYCQCDPDLLHDIAWSEHDELDLESIGVILALAGIYPVDLVSDLTATRIKRVKKADDWLKNVATTDSQLSTYFTHQIVG